MSKVRLGCSQLRISLPVFVALEKGLFKKHGLSVDLTMYETAQPLMADLLDKKIDIGGYTALPITYDGVISTRKKLYYLTTMIEDQDHRVSYLLKSSQSTLKKVSDLKGCKIGILPTHAYRSWLDVILKKNGLEKNVVIEEIPPHAQMNALASGQVDALFTNDPMATTIVKKKLGKLFSAENEALDNIKNPLPFGSFNVSKEWADKNPKMFKNLALALDEAVVFTNQNPEEAKQFMKNYIAKEYQDFVKEMPDAKYLKTEESPLSLFQHVEEDYLKLGVLEQSPRSIWFGCGWRFDGKIGSKLHVSKLTASHQNNADEKLIFKDLSFGVQPGEIVGIFGPNGSGKSTLLRTLAGFHQADAGSVQFPEVGIHQTELSYVSQNYRESFFNWASLRGNIKLVMNNEQDADNVIDETLKAIGLDLDLSLKPKQCSGGMLQQAAILRAFCKNPSVFLADEPFSALDVDVVRKVRQAFSNFVRSNNIAAVLVLHNLEDMLEVCDRLIVVNGTPFSTKKLKGFAPMSIFENERLNTISKKKAKPIQFDKIIQNMLALS